MLTSHRDQGTDVVDILAGRIIPLRLGYVPVVNRGQRDIDTKKAISQALEHEREFFENHSAYRTKSQYCGTPFLARKLNMVRSRFLLEPMEGWLTVAQILMHHIRNTLPEIKSKIQSSLAKYQSELASLGGPMGEGSSVRLVALRSACFAVQRQHRATSSSRSSRNSPPTSGPPSTATATTSRSLNCQAALVSASSSTSSTRMASSPSIPLTR